MFNNLQVALNFEDSNFQITVELQWLETFGTMKISSRQG